MIYSRPVQDLQDLQLNNLPRFVFRSRGWSDPADVDPFWPGGWLGSKQSVPPTGQVAKAFLTSLSTKAIFAENFMLVRS